MYAPSKLLLKEAKIKNAEKVKKEKKRWKEEKLMREKEKSDLVRKKNQEINDLESAFLLELAKKKEKKEKEKEGRLFVVKTQKLRARDRYLNSECNIESESKSIVENEASERLIHLENSRRNIYETPKRAVGNKKSDNSLDTRKPSEIQTNASDYYNLQTKLPVTTISQENYSINRPRDSNDMRLGSPFKSGESLVSIQRSDYSEQRKLREKRRKKNKKTFLPLILKPVGNGVLTIHILNDTKPIQSKSENSSPAKEFENSVHKPYFHMFRDVETTHRSNNLIPESKIKVMQDYDKLVKRNFTPKPDINYNLRLESKKLEKYMENTAKRVKLLKIF